MQASSAAGARADGPAGELCHWRGVRRGDPIAHLSSTKPALSETELICVSHYAARAIPFALAKSGYPLMRATKHQRTALPSLNSPYAAYQTPPNIPLPPLPYKHVIVTPLLSGDSL
jgi:hypothetical protein